MKFAKTLLVSLGLACLVACTVIPATPRAKVASWDGSEQNSGLIAQLPDKSGLVTDHAHDRYLLLCAQYGQKLEPPDTTGQRGLTVWSNAPAGPVWRIDAEHLANLGILTMWKEKGVK